MAKCHWIQWILCAYVSSILHRGNALLKPQPAPPLLQLRNFHRPETSTGMSRRSDGMSIKRRDSAAEFLGITADNNKAPRQHRQHVLSESKNSAEIVPYQEAPPPVQMDKSDSLPPQWLANERERWHQVQPSSFPNSFSSPNPYARSNPAPFVVYPSPSPNPPRSAYPSPSLNPSRLANPPPFQNPSAYPSTVSYPSPSFAPAFENNRVSLSPLPRQNNLIPLHPQPSSPSPNWMPEEMQTATVVAGGNRGDGSKDLMAKLWTFGTVTPTPVNHGDVTTKMYQMIFDEHGNMHMNSAGLQAYWDKKLKND